MSKKLEVGDVLYRLYQRRNQDPSIVKMTVEKIGNKYFYCANWKEKFDKVTLRFISDYSSMNNIQLYRTEQEITDMLQHEDLSKKVRKFFDGFGSVPLNLSQLTRIADIINEGK